MRASKVGDGERLWKGTLVRRNRHFHYLSQMVAVGTPLKGRREPETRDLG